MIIPQTLLWLKGKNKMLSVHKYKQSIKTQSQFNINRPLNQGKILDLALIIKKDKSNSKRQPSNTNI